MTATTTAELAVYAALSIPTGYNLIRHGRIGILGWAFLFVFCSLLVIGGAMSLAGNKSAIIVSNVGLSPLLLAASGILHEARFYRNRDLNQKIEWVVVLTLHLLVTAGIAILAVGASSLQGPHPQSQDLTLMNVGIAMLLVAWVCVSIWSVFSCVARRGRVRASTKRSGDILLLAVLLSDVFIGIRIIYMVVVIAQGNLLKATAVALAVEVIFSVLPGMIAAVVFIVAGILTRNAARQTIVTIRHHELTSGGGTP